MASINPALIPAHGGPPSPDSESAHGFFAQKSDSKRALGERRPRRNKSVDLLRSVRQKAETRPRNGSTSEILGERSCGGSASDLGHVLPDIRVSLEDAPAPKLLFRLPAGLVASHPLLCYLYLPNALSLSLLRHPLHLLRPLSSRQLPHHHRQSLLVSRHVHAG